MVRILPQQFYDDPAMHKILVDGHSCIIHKTLNQTVYGKEGYLTTHAMTMVMQGVLRIENDEGLFEEVPAGSIVLLPKGLYTVSDILTESGRFEAIMFFFETEVIRQFLDSLQFKGGKEKSVTHALLSSHTDMRYFAESLLRLYGNEETHNRLLTKMKLFELLHLLQSTFQDKTIFPAILSALDNRERKSLREFMLANFHKPLGIEDYAYITGRSVSTFTRDFKARFDGIAPKQWLIDRRLEKARELLAHGRGQQVSDVALESGYENVPHFIKEFHKRFGITPKQYLIEQRNALTV